MEVTFLEVLATLTKLVYFSVLDSYSGGRGVAYMMGNVYPVLLEVIHHLNFLGHVAVFRLVDIFVFVIFCSSDQDLKLSVF